MSFKSFLIKKKNVPEHNAVGVSDLLCKLLVECLFSKF